MHGTAYETNRNNGIGLARARTDFYTKAPQLNKNEYGFNLGGPVYIPKLYNGKNKTFWFVNYEGERLAQLTTSTYNVPTNAMRGGDFSGLIDTQGRLSPAGQCSGESQYLPVCSSGRAAVESGRFAFQEYPDPRKSQPQVYSGLLQCVQSPGEPEQHWRKRLSKHALPRQ